MNTVVITVIDQKSWDWMPKVVLVHSLQCCMGSAARRVWCATWLTRWTSTRVSCCAPAVKRSRRYVANCATRRASRHASIPPRVLSSIPHAQPCSIARTQGSMCCDFFLTTICPPCALCQMHRELKSINLLKSAPFEKRLILLLFWDHD